ncbi:MAG: hypothetical protein ACO3EZ_12280 [Prochlorotrichaceae cyanobacterium]
MTLQREQIDTLLAEIDGVLSKANPRLPWVMSSEVTQQRQTLERIRSYLKGLQSEPGFSSLEPAYNPWGDTAPTTNLEVSSALRTDWVEQANSPQAALNLSQQMMQAFTQDLAQLRSSLLQPLHAETVRLQQQRDSLLQEVRQLERQRQQHSLIQQRAGQEQQVYEFLQGLMDRLQERLSQQISQIVGTIAAGNGQNAIAPYPTDSISSLVLDGSPNRTSVLPAEAGLPPLAPAQRVEQLQMLQARADQVVVTLDTTLRAFAEALQQNIQSYESSLSQGLEKMHTMGQQGEAIVANLVQKLADQVSGQVISGALPSATPSGSRPQSFNAQGFTASSGIPSSQHFTTYASPEPPDRAVNRFRVPANSSPQSTPPTPQPALSKATPEPLPPPDPRKDAGNLTKTDWDTSQTDLDLDLELLEQLEQADAPLTAAEPADLQEDEPQAGNEELDAFYASLFGDTNRNAGSPPLESAQPPEQSEAVAMDANFADLDPLEEDLFLEDPLAGDFEEEELIHLELEEEEPAETPVTAPPSSAEPLSSVASEAQDHGDEFESAMDPLAALSLNAQGSPPETPSSDVAADPLIADLEEALEALNAPDLNAFPTTDLGTDLGSPEPPTIVAEPPSTTRSRPLTSSGQPGSQSIPAEDIIRNLTDVLIPSPAGASPAGATVPAALRHEPTLDPGIAPGTVPLGSAAVTPWISPTPVPATAPQPSPEPGLAEVGEDEVYPSAGPEESLLVQDEAEESAHVELYLEPETLHQLKEDLSKLEQQAPEDSEDFFNLGAEDSRPEEGLAEEDVFGSAFNEAIPAPEIPLPQGGSTPIAPPEEEDLWEEGSPEESLLPEAEDHNLDWLAIETGRPSEPSPTPNRSPSPGPGSSLSFDLLANSAFEGSLEEDLDLDSSFEEDNELSLDRMTDWFAEEPDTSGSSTVSESEESLLIDNLFADLPDAEKKNDWPL